MLSSAFSSFESWPPRFGAVEVLFPLPFSEDDTMTNDKQVVKCPGGPWPLVVGFVIAVVVSVLLAVFVLPKL